MATPSRIRSVTAAAKASAAIGSSTLWYTGSICDPAGISSRWKLHSEWYPARSAAAETAARFCGVAQAPDTGAPNPMSILLTLAGRAAGWRRAGTGDDHVPVKRRFAREH